MRNIEVRTNQGLQEKEALPPVVRHVVELVEGRQLQSKAIIYKALIELEQRHADKAYHGVEHTATVMDRVARFLDVVREEYPEVVSDRHYELALVAAAYHDICQDYYLVDGRRHRKVGHNEDQSALGAVQEMRTVVLSNGEPFFDERDEAWVADAIMHTVPAWDPEARTVHQPRLTPESSLLARALAYADIGAAGMDGAAAIIQDGNELFIEDNVELVAATRQGAVTGEVAEDLRTRLLAWTRMQEAFVEGRRNRLDTELAGLPDRLRYALKTKLFVKFDESLAAAKQLVEEREGMTFEQLVESVGVV